VKEEMVEEKIGGREEGKIKESKTSNRNCERSSRVQRTSSDNQ
jgi:hypothetical protein